jgi:ferric-dicitrate binding protein FerR (iron transport regulator)
MKSMTDAQRWRLLELAERASTDQLSPEDKQELNNTLRSSDEARVLLARALQLQAELRIDPRLSREQVETEVAKPRPTALQAYRVLAWAASLLLLGSLTYTWLAPRGYAEPLTIATVIKASHCKWSGSTLPTAEGSRVTAGTLELVEGLATVRFDSGAEIALEAPATLELIDAMNCKLKRGTLVADVPPSAIGFTVDTKDAKVVDYGTRFGVSTGEDGKYMVQVLEGLVEVNHKGEGAARQLRAGQSVDRGLMKQKVNPLQDDDEPNRWQPDMILNAGDGWQVISTAYGRGKDTYIQSSEKSKDFGGDSYFRVKHTSLQPELNRKGYVAFDIEKFNRGSLADAELVLSIEPSDLGFATLVPDATFAIYGLNDEAQDSWQEHGLSWQEAPAHDAAQAAKHVPVGDKVTLLGRFDIAQGINRGTRSLHGAALMEFLKQDTNGIVTFILCRETDETAKSGLVHAFATKESGGNTPPLLRLKLAPQ